MGSRGILLTGTGLVLGVLIAGVGCEPKTQRRADDAQGRKPEDFPELALDVFREMDGGIGLSPDEIKGRNTWNLWTAGNEQFWDRMARESYGLIDLLKTLDSRKRSERFRELGLINQPGFRQAQKPDQYGLWLDEAETPEPPGIDLQVYGRPSGAMGFRLFDNPAFKGDAVTRWNPERYDRDPDYAVDPNLVRPYRVGVSCGSCHIAFHPLRPPADPVNPGWENLSSTIGNQYLNEGRVFAYNVKEGGFFWEMIKTQPRGTSDTSRIATDNINNPNAINPIFDLGARLKLAETGNHLEKVAGETLLLPEERESMAVPRVLKDGADSVGVAGATIRVFVNIGLYHQHWLDQHNPLVGLTGQRPFSIDIAQKNSVYWRATEQKVANVAKFFYRIKPMHLAYARGGKDHLTASDAVLTRGKLVFAEHCASCHSSKRPPEGSNETDWFKKEVLKGDFLEDNFLSDERRHSVARIQTNSARACATNAKRGHIWQNFSSETYKAQPSVGEIEFYNPYTDRNEKFAMPPGGPGYYRTPSLISLWTSAPFFHNNSLGKFTGDPSVAGRMEAFNDAVEKLLWPSKRLGRESIWRTSRECSLQLQGQVLPEPLRTLLKPHLDPDGYLRLGPIPAGTPINLLANVDPETSHKDLLALCIKVKKALLEIKLKALDSAGAREVMKAEVAPVLVKVSKCPDLIEDRGHHFGTELPDSDKRALIEFLKTL